MATKVLMEALSPTMEEGRLVEWKKQEGDTVAPGDVLAEVETDKAVMDLVARVGGTLLKQVIAAGATVPVTALVGVIGKTGEDISGLVGGQGGLEDSLTVAAGRRCPSSAGAASRDYPKWCRLRPRLRLLSLPPRPPHPPRPPRPTASRHRHLRERSPPTGESTFGQSRAPALKGGSVLRDLATAAPMAAAPSSTALPFRPSGAAYTDVPLTQLRKTIAKRLSASIGPIPTFYLTAEIDMERAWEAREALKGLGPEGKVSFNDIVVKGVALSLRQHPGCNAWWQDDRIRYWNEVHVSMAVAIDDGLITPVIRHADLKSLRQISAESKDLAGRARERKLKPEEYTGGTFSVSNLGMFDIDQFTAIINPPEAGILAIGAIVEKAVVTEGVVGVRRRMRVTLSCDHRVIDGATGAAFLKTLKTLLENPLAMVW